MILSKRSPKETFNMVSFRKEYIDFFLEGLTPLETSPLCTILFLNSYKKLDTLETEGWLSTGFFSKLARVT